MKKGLQAHPLKKKPYKYQTIQFKQADLQQGITAMPLNSIELNKQQEVRLEAEERLMDMTFIFSSLPMFFLNVTRPLFQKLATFNSLSLKFRSNKLYIM